MKYPPAARVILADGTVLRVSTWANGEVLSRSGTDAVGVSAGSGTTDHAALSSNLAWSTSGHTGTASRLAGFSGAGAATTYQIGTDVQAYDAGLASLTGADAAAGFAYPSAANTWTSLTGFATGGMIYASSASAFAKLAIGTSGQVLTVSGGLPAWTTLTPALLGVTSQAETPAGTVNGINDTFTLSFTPSDSAAVIVLVNRLAQRNGIDFTVSGSTITMAYAPATSSTIFAVYYAATVAPTRAAWAGPSTRTANYTALVTDDFVPLNANAGGFTLTLPAASSATNPINAIRVDSASGNTLTIAPDGADTIMGAASTILPINSTYRLFPIGTDWRIT